MKARIVNRRPLIHKLIKIWLKTGQIFDSYQIKMETSIVCATDRKSVTCYTTTIKWWHWQNDGVQAASWLGRKL